MASHDLRSPLRAISALAHYVRSDEESRLGAGARERLEDIQRRIDRLGALLQGLLEYARAGQHAAAPTPLELVFRNLIANAVRHHHRAEGNTVISGRLLASGFAEFTIADDGPGIAEPYRERIFNLFETLQPSGQRGGIGLGLALVKRTVDLNGRCVRVHDTPGGGATFSFSWWSVRDELPSAVGEART